MGWDLRRDTLRFSTGVANYFSFNYTLIIPIRRRRVVLYNFMLEILSTQQIVFNIVIHIFTTHKKMLNFGSHNILISL